MSLFDILNDKNEFAKIIDSTKVKFKSEDFWKDDEKNYNLAVKEIEKKHDSIKMSQKKYHSVFSL